MDTALSSLATALNALTRVAVSSRFHEETVRRTGVRVTRSGLRFLSLVADEGPVSGTRLATALDLSQPTASRTLQSLEAEGLVARQASRSDGRVSHYVATERGREALAQVHAFHVAQLALVLADVQPGRRADLAGALTELVDRLSPPVAPSSLTSASRRSTTAHVPAQSADRRTA